MDKTIQEYRGIPHQFSNNLDCPWNTPHGSHYIPAISYCPSHHIYQSYGTVGIVCGISHLDPTIYLHHPSRPIVLWDSRDCHHIPARSYCPSHQSYGTVGIVRGIWIPLYTCQILPSFLSHIQGCSQDFRKEGVKNVKLLCTKCAKFSDWKPCHPLNHMGAGCNVDSPDAHSRSALAQS